MGVTRKWYGEGDGTPLQYSCLENLMDRGAWWAAVHVVAKSRTRLNNFIFTFHFHALEKEITTHSSVLAWRIPGMGEPGGLPSMGVTQSRTRLKWRSSSSSSNMLYKLLGTFWFVIILLLPKNEGRYNALGMWLSGAWNVQLVAGLRSEMTGIKDVP